MDSSLPPVRTYPVLSRRQIEGQIADGRHIVIVNQHVLKVDAWLKYHPGGDIAIKHMVGRDATDEVTACVPTRPPRTLISDQALLTLVSSVFTLSRLSR